MRCFPEITSYGARSHRWHRPLLLTVIQILLGGVSLGQDKAVPIETIEAARYAVAPIVCIAESPPGTFNLNGTIGSGFFINEDGYFMTAAHVLTSLEERNKDKQGCPVPAVYLPIGGWEADQAQPKFQWYSFTECLKDDKQDIGVCRPKLNPFRDPRVSKGVRTMTFAARSIPADGTPVAFTGFPLNLLRPVTSKANVASYLPTEPFVMIDKTAWPGASGSPLYLHDGTVVGLVVRRGLNDASGLAYVRPVESLTQFLGKIRVAFHREK